MERPPGRRTCLYAAEQLNVEMPHIKHSCARFSNTGVRVRQQLVERSTSGKSRLEFRGTVSKIRVGHTRVFFGQLLNLHR